PVKVVSGAMVPYAPQNLTASPGESAAQLHWTRSTANDIYFYRIYGGSTPNPLTPVDSTMYGDPDDTTASFTGLTNYTEMFYRVVAIDSAGNISPYSNEVSVTPSDKTAPAAPVNLAVVDSVASYFTIAWNMNSETDIAKYYIYRDTLPNPTTLIDSTVNVVDTVRAFTTLTIGQPYYFRVAAVDTSGNVGALSNEVTAVPYMIHSIYAYSYGNGVLTPGGTNYVDHGDSLQFTIQADPLHHIDSIAIDPNIIMIEERAITGIGTDDAKMKRRTKTAAPLEQMADPITLVGTGNDDTLRTYTFTNVIAIHTIKAYFSKNTFTINTSIVGNGTILPADSSIVFYGDTIQFSICADQFHHTDSVLVDGVKTDSLYTYTFSNVTAPHTITAYFSPNVFDHFIVESPVRGPIDPQIAGAPFLILVTAVDAGGNPVDSFTGNVWFSSTDTMMSVLGESYSNSFIAGAHGPQQVTLYSAGMQTISVIDSVSGRSGTSDPFFVNAAGLHHFSVYDTSGSPVSDQVEGRMFPVKIVAMDNFNNVQSDYSGQVDVNIDDGESGVFFGATTNFTGGIFSPYFAQIDAIGTFSVTVNDNMAERGGGSNTFTVVSDTNFIYAVSTNGSISPFDSIAVQYGDTALFSFSPMPGYHFDSLMVDGVRIPDSTSHYTFFNVTGPHMIEVYNSVNLNIPPMFTVVLSDTAIARFDTLSFSYGVSDPDFGIIRYSIESGPAGAVIDSVTGLLTFIPAADANGTYPLMVKAVDDSLAAIVDTVNIRVNIYGDVSGNGTISAYDGSLVLIQSVGGMVFTPLQEKVADVSAAPGISAMDASYILQRAVGLISAFPGGLGKQERAEAVLSAFSFRIQKSEKQDEYDLFVSVNKASNTFGIVMSLGFDSSIVRPLAMSKTASTDSMSMAFHFPSEKANLALAGVTPMTSAGDIIKFTFQLKDPNYPKNAVLFTMKKFILNETDHTNDIGGITLNVRNLAQLPTVYKLEQNYPNPFNPSTTINYQLPEAGSVRIVIYNMLGQMVRTLVNEEQSAGYYSQIWNGADDSNRKVASGVYIYRIEALGAQNRRFTEVKKMIMIK
ncbi:MAG: T9SS type A sorting domain-containing protein, partial [Bacteroidetes bacterium]|nr:T9SS type A sorting domain-containing protein [Bacteroidota bacterium]